MSVESRVGEGSCFRLRIPVRLGAKRNAGKRIRPNRITGLKPGQRTYDILVADDNTENRRILADLLSAAGFRVIEAENGKEAVSRFSERRIDLIFMDVNMDVMDGYEATKMIRAGAGGTDVPIIAVTANAFNETKENIMKAGVDKIIVKPFKEREIFAAVRRFLGIEYSYRSVKPAAGEISAEDLTDTLGALPSDLAERILAASRDLEIKSLLAAIDQVESISPAAAGYLRSIARKYQYETIIGIFRKAGPDDE